MSNPRTERRLSIWQKVEECQQSLGKIHAIENKVEQLATLERLLALKNNRKTI